MPKLTDDCDDARAFNCRSFAQKDDRCFLSGDDSATLGGVPQPVDIGAVYEEKVCTKSKETNGCSSFYWFDRADWRIC